MTRPWLSIFVLFATVAVATVPACGNGEPSADDPVVRKQAMNLWRERCATCHGMDGDGDGPQARYLEVKPRALSDRQWKNSVTDEHLRTVIVQGGPAVGLNLAMAPNPDLGKEPAVLEALVQHVRGL